MLSGYRATQNGRSRCQSHGHAAYCMCYSPDAANARASPLASIAIIILIINGERTTLPGTTINFTRDAQTIDSVQSNAKVHARHSLYYNAHSHVHVELMIAHIQCGDCAQWRDLFPSSPNHIHPTFAFFCCSPRGDTHTHRRK